MFLINGSGDPLSLEHRQIVPCAATADDDTDDNDDNIVDVSADELEKYFLNVAHLGIVAVILHGHLVGGGLCRQVEGGHPVFFPSDISFLLEMKTVFVDFTFGMTPCHFNNLRLG